MRILAIGDIVGKPGREYVYQNLGRIRKKYNMILLLQTEKIQLLQTV